MTEMLTPLEHKAVDQCADLWDTLLDVVALGQTRGADLAELAAHVHAIQNVVLAQAAGRAYPDKYRLLGSDRSST